LVSVLHLRRTSWRLALPIFLDESSLAPISLNLVRMAPHGYSFICACCFFLLLTHYNPLCTSSHFHEPHQLLPIPHPSFIPWNTFLVSFSLKTCCLLASLFARKEMVFNKVCVSSSLTHGPKQSASSVYPYLVLNWDVFNISLYANASFNPASTYSIDLKLTNCNLYKCAFIWVLEVEYSYMLGFCSLN
jgi:hypothetical protein